MSQRKPEPFQGQAEKRIQEEAFRLARGIQVPGQTKEQTKLIAKGIEKGIAAYKAQEKAKARERDRAKKRALRAKSPPEAGSGLPRAGSASGSNSVPLALLLAAAFFSLAGLAHAVRYVLNGALVIGHYAIPPIWSLPAALVAWVLAFWFFRLGRRRVAIRDS